MLFHVFYSAFLILQFHAAILFFKQVSVGSEIKLMDGGNSSLTYINANYDLYVERFIDEELEHSFTEAIGYNASNIKRATKQSDEYPNDYYIVWGENNACFLQF